MVTLKAQMRSDHPRVPQESVNVQGKEGSPGSFQVCGRPSYLQPILWLRPHSLAEAPSRNQFTATVQKHPPQKTVVQKTE